MRHEHHKSTADKVFPGVNGLPKVFYLFPELLEREEWPDSSACLEPTFRSSPSPVGLGLPAQYLGGGVSLHGALESQLLEHAFQGIKIRLRTFPGFGDTQRQG